MRRILVRNQQFHYQGKQDVHSSGAQQLRVYCCFGIVCLKMNFVMGAMESQLNLVYKTNWDVLIR